MPPSAWRDRRRRHPPWWPEGEPWPPAHGAWPPEARRIRRRILLVALTLLVGLVAFGVAIGWAVSTHHQRGGAEQQHFGPGPFLGLVVGVVLIASIATMVAYRRVGAPADELLQAARRVGAGERDVRVEARGPRELRALIDTFNGMAASLRDADDHRRRFLADVAHELRTPIAVLQSSIEAQLDGIHPRDDTHLHSLLEETQVLGRLVEDLSTLALADAGRLTLHLEAIDPSGVAADAVEAASPLAEGKSIAIALDAPDGLPTLDADPTRLRQVLVNLLTNAIRHTPVHGQVAVGVRVDADATVVYTVRDTGRGIPEAQLDSVFDRYTKAADSGGSGLGLAIARDLVLAHGGSIAARNAPGGGAEITFRIPVTGTRPSPRVVERRPGAPAPPGAPPAAW